MDHSAELLANTFKNVSSGVVNIHADSHASQAASALW
jgi:hypothetical protein